MPIFDRPALLGVGVLLALVPPLLHLITRRAGSRVALPTARFLLPDARARIWLQRRPTEIPLLLLRSLILLLLGAAAAGPAWSTPPAGRLDVVLLDRGVGAANWAAAVDSARTRLAAGGVDLILFDTAATHIPASRLRPELLDSIASAPPRDGHEAAAYEAALEGVRDVARSRTDADSLRVTLVTLPRWQAWTDALAWLRPKLWPGAIELVALEAAGTPDPPAGAAPRTGAAGVIAGEGGGEYVEAALLANGWNLVGREMEGDSAPELVVLLTPPPAEAEQDLLERARAGAVIVSAGGIPPGPLGASLPWRGVRADEGAGETPGALFLPDGRSLTGASGRVAGEIMDRARMLAAWEDGRPAAVARPEGEGCLVYIATELESGSLPLSAHFPALIAALAAGCESDDAPTAPLPLDSAATALLRGEELPPVAAASSMGFAPPERRLGRWLILIALLLALVETGVVYRGRAR